jgi:hypothetical protein
MTDRTSSRSQRDYGRLVRRPLSLLAHLMLFVLALFGVVFSFANYPWLAVCLALLILLVVGDGERRRAKARRERDRARRRLSTDTSWRT